MDGTDPAPSKLPDSMIAPDTSQTFSKIGFFWQKANEAKRDSGGAQDEWRATGMPLAATGTADPAVRQG